LKSSEEGLILKPQMMKVFLNKMMFSYACQGFFIKGRVPGKLTTYEENFARLVCHLAESFSHKEVQF